MDMFTLYIVLLLDSIEETAVILAVIAGLISMFMGVFYLISSCEEDYDVAKKLKKVFNISTIVFVVGITVATFVPNTKQMLLIFGVHELTTNEDVGRLSTKSIQAIEKMLDTYLTEDEEKSR